LVSRGRANALISQLMELGILDVVDGKGLQGNIFRAPRHRRTHRGEWQMRNVEPSEGWRET
jgi:hypothetical protein